MQIKWVKRPLERLRSQFIYLSPKGPVVFNEVGSIVEVDDEVGYMLLKDHKDMLEKAPEPVAQEEVSEPVKAMRVPRNKRMKSYEDK